MAILYKEVLSLAPQAPSSWLIALVTSTDTQRDKDAFTHFLLLFGDTNANFE